MKKKLRVVCCVLVFFFLIPVAYSSQAAFKQAFESFLKGDYASAQKNIESSPLSKNDSLFDYSLWILGKSALENKNYNVSIQSLQKLIASEPSSIFASAAKVALGKSYFETKDYSKAKEFLGRELDSIEGSLKGEALYYLGSAEVESAERARGISHLQEAYEKYPNVSTDSLVVLKLRELEPSQYPNGVSTSSQVSLQRADRFFETKNFTRSLEVYNALLVSSDASIKGKARIKKGKALYALKKYSEAIPFLEVPKDSAISLELKRDSLFALANSYQKLGNSSDAIPAFEKVKSEFPQSVEAEESYFRIGKIKFDQGNFSEAEQTFEQLAQNYPQGKFRDQGLWLIGWNAYRKADWSNALKFFSLLENGATDAPTKGKAIYWQAKVLEKQENAQLANETFQRAAQSSPFSYYGFMALKQLKKSKDLSETPVVPKDWVILKIPVSTDKNKKAMSPHYSKTIALYSLGFGRQSLAELEQVVKESQGDTNLLLEVMKAFRSSDASFIPVLLGQKYWDIFKKAFVDPVVAEQYRNFLQYPFPFQSLIQKTAKAFSLSPHFVVALMRQESGFQPWVISSANAQGLMQLLPSTAQLRARKLNVQVGDLLNPESNIRLGTAELAAQLEKFSGNWVAVMAAYNAGPGRASEWLSQNGNLPIDEFIEEIPFSETNLYVKLVLRNYWVYKTLYSSL